MFDTDYSGWAVSTWLLYAMAFVYLVCFLWFWMRLETAERRAKRQGGEAVLAYNRMLKGFPNAVFAKMFGKRAFEVKEAPRGE